MTLAFELTSDPDELRELLLRQVVVHVHAVIGGPAEAWRYNETGLPVGESSGRPTLQLDDFVTVLRTFSPGGSALRRRVLLSLWPIHSHLSLLPSSMIAGMSWTKLRVFPAWRNSSLT